MQLFSSVIFFFFVKSRKAFSKTNHEAKYICRYGNGVLYVITSLSISALTQHPRAALHNFS